MQINDTLLANLEQLGNWGILTTDSDLKITGWNRWLEKHSGKTATQVVGQHLLTAFPDLVARGIDHYFRQAQEGQAIILSQRFHNYVLPLPPTVAGSVMHMQQTVRISPLLENEKVCGTITLIEDVTERVVTERELRQQAERLEEANRHKDEFMAMLAHELRNPLAPLRNGVRVLDIVHSDSPEAKKTREMMERQVTHMSRLIDDLLDISRIVRGTVTLQKETCDLIPVIRNVAQDFGPILSENGITFSTDIPSDPCWIRGDAVRIAQVVSNLLHNANKFTNEEGAVRLSVRIEPANEEVSIKVTDSGIGMTASTISRVFDAFSQAESSLARSKGGLGLGLALVKGLTELHGGRVEASSVGIGLGSTFTVYLPTTSLPAATEHKTASQTMVERLVKRVLIIEDNRDTALSLKLLLNQFQYEVDVAYSGSEGVAIAQRMSPDVVLCDIGLPGLDGYAVARTLRDDIGTRDAFLIAQSGYGQAEDIRKAHEAGFDVHLIKPVDFQELRQILDLRDARAKPTAGATRS